jgi:uncharacterized OB-fold protein
MTASAGADPASSGSQLPGLAWPVGLCVDGAPVLLGSRCTACSIAMFPPQAVCPACMCEALAEEAMPRRGQLYASSTVHVGPAKWHKPFTIGYVDLPNGVRVFSHLVGDPAIGAEVELDRAVVGREADGSAIESFVFRAVEG